MEMVMSFISSPSTSSPLLYPKLKLGRTFTPLINHLDCLSSSSRTSVSLSKQALKFRSKTPVRSPVKCSVSQTSEAPTGTSLSLSAFVFFVHLSACYSLARFFHRFLSPESWKNGWGEERKLLSNSWPL